MEIAISAFHPSRGFKSHFDVSLHCTWPCKLQYAFLGWLRRRHRLRVLAPCCLPTRTTDWESDNIGQFIAELISHLNSPTRATLCLFVARNPFVNLMDFNRGKRTAGVEWVIYWRLGWGGGGLFKERRRRGRRRKLRYLFRKSVCQLD